METTKPTGTILFTSVGRPSYGFDIFSVNLSNLSETRLTDGLSINFNAQFINDDENQALVYISERNGSPQIFINRPNSNKPVQLTPSLNTHFQDRPIVKNNTLYFISAHEEPTKPFQSWTALYSTRFNQTGETEKEIARLTPNTCSDFSPAISKSGNLIAVASYLNGVWKGEFHDLKTSIVVFRENKPEKRVVVCDHGGWPTWCGENVVYFHRQADDGWWSVFRVEFSRDLAEISLPVRITPAGVHCFTPVVMNDGERIAVATRRKGGSFRHVEIFDVGTKEFVKVTEGLNPGFHHYNPFVSLDSGFIGYHRFRGEGVGVETRIPHFQKVRSPVGGVGMVRLNGSFPSFSPCGGFVALNHDFDVNGGVKVVKTDGSKRWDLVEGRTAFYNSWSPAEDNVVFTSIGPIFQGVRASVQIARVTFDMSKLRDDVEKVPVEVKILTKEETGNNAFPSCSPDGKSLVFRSGRSGHKNLYIVDAVNGEFEGGIRQLTDGPWIDTMPHWSPDGKLIAFSSNRHNPDNPAVFGIYVINPDGTGLRRIKVAGSDDERERLNHVCFSADGEWLLFTANLAGVTAEPVSLPNQFQPYGDLYLVRLDGSGLQRLTWNGYENGTPTWYPKVLFEDDDVVKFSGLSLGGDGNGEDKLTGQFDEPLWIQCDF